MVECCLHEERATIDDTRYKTYRTLYLLLPFKNREVWIDVLDAGYFSRTTLRRFAARVCLLVAPDKMKFGQPGLRQVQQNTISQDRFAIVFVLVRTS